MDNDGYISNGELFQVLKMMVGSNLKDTQLQQIVDKTILFADKVHNKTFKSCLLKRNNKNLLFYLKNKPRICCASTKQRWH